MNHRNYIVYNKNSLNERSLDKEFLKKLKARLLNPPKKSQTLITALNSAIIEKRIRYNKPNEITIEFNDKKAKFSQEYFQKFLDGILDTYYTNKRNYAIPAVNRRVKKAVENLYDTLKQTKGDNEYGEQFEVDDEGDKSEANEETETVTKYNDARQTFKEALSTATNTNGFVANFSREVNNLMKLNEKSITNENERRKTYSKMYLAMTKMLNKYRYERSSSELKQQLVNILKETQNARDSDPGTTRRKECNGGWDDNTNVKKGQYNTPPKPRLQAKEGFQGLLNEISRTAANPYEDKYMQPLRNAGRVNNGKIPHPWLDRWANILGKKKYRWQSDGYHKDHKNAPTKQDVSQEPTKSWYYYEDEFANNSPNTHRNITAHNARVGGSWAGQGRTWKARSTTFGTSTAYNGHGIYGKHGR
jgi:hypothetical protein